MSRVGSSLEAQAETPYRVKAAGGEWQPEVYLPLPAGVWARVFAFIEKALNHEFPHMTAQEVRWERDLYTVSFEESSGDIVVLVDPRHADRFSMTQGLSRWMQQAGSDLAASKGVVKIDPALERTPDEMDVIERRYHFRREEARAKVAEITARLEALPATWIARISLEAFQAPYYAPVPVGDPLCFTPTKPPTETSSSETTAPDASQTSSPPTEGSTERSSPQESSSESPTSTKPATRSSETTRTPPPSATSTDPTPTIPEELATPLL